MSWSISNAMMKAYENSPCSQERAAASSAVTCSDGEPSALSNTTPMPDQYYWPDKTTEHSRLLRSGTTCELLTASHGEALLTWFRAAFPVKTSVAPEPELVSTASEADCGQRWQGSLAKYDPATHSLKTAQCSLIEDLTGCSVTLPQWGSMRSGACYLRPIPALPICESASGLWQTPVADDAVSRVKGKINSRGEPKLSAQVKRWPTPTVCGNYNRPGISKTSGLGLASAVKMWPTPCASASKGSSPAALVRKSGKSRERDRLDHAVMASDGGQLNPEFVEWLMGWPIGLTALKPLETARFREWQQQHSPSYPLSDAA